MIKITVDKKHYKGVYSWSDITLAKYCELSAIPLPDSYEAYILADGKYSQDNIEHYIEAVSHITDHHLNVLFPEYYRKVINCLTDIPASKKLPDEMVERLYEYYLKPFVVSIIYHTPVIHFMGQIKQYEPDRIKEFTVDGQTFKVPESVNIMGQDVPLMNESIITFTEASDIFRGMKLTKDDLKRLALFMAIYCRKKGEQYDERLTLERESLFLQAPMSVVWAVFFCIIRWLPDYMNCTLLFGGLPKLIRGSVSEVRTYQSMAAGV